ncbi:MAG TPA: TldD/PmbA family protein [Gemmatimonadales bacterium]|nr:TldD/PmbA family protein [Gemmatimonadales bacterium]
MIERWLDAAQRAGAQQADGWWHRAERTVVSFEWGRLKAASVGEEAGVNLRVLSQGRVGVAGSTVLHDGPDDLTARALASAALGERFGLEFPGPCTPAVVSTFSAPAAEASLDHLVGIGREVVERLARDGCQVNVTVEREVTETEFGNTAGAAGTYQATAVAVSADVWRIAGDDVLTVADGIDDTGVPDASALSALVQSIDERLRRAEVVVAPPEGGLPVVFTPAGLAAVLLPITQALSGKAVLQGVSPLAGRVGERVFDAAFSVTDDPTRAGRPASRPFDDEGVASRPTPLVEAGTVRGFIFDLETAARAKATSTGHGHRDIFGKPAPGFTNLVVGRDDGTPDGALGGQLLGPIVDGLLVDDLIGVGQGNVAGGAFSHPVALAYRVVRGEIAGRVKDAAVAGNSYDLLKRIGGIGRDRRWYGRRLTPSLLFDGVSVARR